MVLTGDTEVLGEKHYIAWVVGEWMGMEHWWNGTDRGYWNTGRETLYSVGGRWMNGYGALVEWYWQGKTEVLGEKHYIAWVVGEWMGMEHWWNDTDRGNWSVGRETLYSVGGRWMNGYGVFGGMILTGENWSAGRKTYHIDTLCTTYLFMDWRGIEPGPPRWQAVDQPPESWHGHVYST